MQIAIDIPQRLYDEITSDDLFHAHELRKAVRQAIVLPLTMTSKDVRTAIEKQTPKCPTTYIVNGIGIQKRCPTCDKILYDNDWSASMNREGFTQYCIYCGQRFTKKGRYIGEWEAENGSD